MLLQRGGKGRVVLLCDLSGRPEVGFGWNSNRTLGNGLLFLAGCGVGWCLSREVPDLGHVRKQGRQG